MTEFSLGLFFTVISQLFVPFYSIVTTAIYRHFDDSTIVRLTIAIYRDYRQYRASLVAMTIDRSPSNKRVTMCVVV